ncbi:hypothetical protein BPC006_II1171 [Burkholderia pseudomallei BPC006]|nr:hypothetical protein BPC006_II1171 [Burkholderia pseudomallei BPC006]
MTHAAHGRALRRARPTRGAAGMRSPRRLTD